MYQTFIYKPLYNGLILLVDTIPFVDAGIAIILFTIIVKLILFPLSKKAARTQLIMREAEPELRKIKEKHPDRQEQARKIMDFYKEKKINPFSSMLVLIIQIPVLIALYKIFYTGALTSLHPELLYSFVRVPEAISTTFLGLFDITVRSIPLALVAAVCQYFQTKIVMPPVPATGDSKFSQDFARMMSLQIKYFFPVMIFLAAYFGSGAIALYLITSCIFTIGQELAIRKQLKRERGTPAAIEA